MVSFTDASSCAARTFLTEKLDEYRVKRGVNGVPSHQARFAAIEQPRVPLGGPKADPGSGRSDLVGVLVLARPGAQSRNQGTRPRSVDW